LLQEIVLWFKLKMPHIFKYLVKHESMFKQNTDRSDEAPDNIIEI